MSRVEPGVIHATVRESENDTGDIVNDIECRFDDGQKFAAVAVDGDFPELADKIARFLSRNNNT